MTLIANDQVGLLERFDEKAFEEVILSYIDADEVERALWMLENLPGRYRDNPPDNLRQLRLDVLKSMVTAHAYMSSDLDCDVREDAAVQTLNGTLRGLLIKEEVKRYNDARLTPQIIDVGPGEYFVPLGLKTLEHRFTYWDIGMDQKTKAIAHPMLGELRVKFESPEPKIFLALEIIEHLAEPKELAVEALRHCGAWPDRIHLSTPMYTFDGKKKDWRKPCGLPHLRTYTPHEFITQANEIFPGYQWQFYPGQPMSLRGMRSDKLDKVPLFE